MTSNRAAEIARAVRGLFPAERARHLNEACGDDSALRAAVETLLSEEEATRAFTPGEDPDVFVDAALTAWGAERGATSKNIGPYCLTDKIGEGGFGVVWLAEQEEPIRRQVALKVIKLGMDTADVIRRFEAERQALALMDHPHIAKVLDAGTTPEGRPFFVMELVNGVPIDEYCTKRKLDLRERLQLFIKVCQAVQHAHQKGIIHRDLKPNNVLVAEHDGEALPKVIDFGIAKATGAEAAQHTMLTEQSQFIGTPEYMSPEQVSMSNADIDTRSDIYALGVMLYELLTGARPFDAEELFQHGVLEMIRIIQEEEPTKPSTKARSLGSAAAHTTESLRIADSRTLSAHLRGDLDWIVMKCLAKERDRRYETANGLAADLQRHLKDEPVSAGPPSAQYRIGKFVRRNRIQVVACGLLLVALVVGAIGTTYGMVQAERELARATNIKGLVTDMLRSVSPNEMQYMDKEMMLRILADAANRIESGEIEDELVSAELALIVATTYLDLREDEAALPHARRADEIRQRRLGADDREVLEARYILALATYRTGDTHGGGAMFREVAADRMRLFGERDRDTIDAQRSVLALDLFASLAAPAPELLARGKRLVRIAREVLEPGDELLASCDKALEDAFDAAGDLKGMLQHAEQSHRWADEAFTPAHPMALMRRARYAQALRIAGQRAEGIALLREGLATAREAHGEDSHVAAEAAMNLSYNLLYVGQYAEGEQLLAPLVNVDAEATLEPEYWGSTMTLGLHQIRQGKFAESLRTQELMQKQIAGLFGGDHHADGDLAFGMALSLEGLGRHDDARPYRETWQRLATGGGHGDEGHGDEPAPEPHDEHDAHAPPHGKEHAEGHGDEHGAAHGVTHLHAAVNAEMAAWSLLAPHTADLHDPRRAVEYATRAVAYDAAVGGHHTWSILSVLAAAQHETGDHAGAVAAIERAIPLIPEGADALVEEQYRAALATYTAAATDTAAPGVDNSHK